MFGVICFTFFFCLFVLANVAFFIHSIYEDGYNNGYTDAMKRAREILYESKEWCDNNGKTE